MTNNEFDSARKQNQGCIVFKLVKDGAERVVAMSKERAKESSTLLPNWTFGALHGSTIHLKGGNSDATVMASSDINRFSTVDDNILGHHSRRVLSGVDAGRSGQTRRTR